MANVVINVQKVRVDADPSVEIYSVDMETDGSTWRETFTTDIELRAFFRGLQAGSAMMHNTLLPGNRILTFHPDSCIQLL
jgi:hypothetical protein